MDIFLKIFVCTFFIFLVLTYVVMVTTGKKAGSQTKASAYLTIHGERGDTGKRLLLNSNCAVKFKPGQVKCF